jgi:hypothetical protein
MLTITWGALVVATALSLLTGEFTGFSRLSTVAIILVLALLKVQMVFTKFVEIGPAPLGWRLFLEGWLLVVVGEIAYFYWR